ncbi:hypothetical protein MMC29_005339 [Sticta canariensis]|nr:hypothetical protein [Sticta canariensis]
MISAEEEKKRIYLQKKNVGTLRECGHAKITSALRQNDIMNNAYGDDLLSRSLQVLSQREGPAILVSNMIFHYGAINSIQLGDNITLRCLGNYVMSTPDDGNATYTEYIRVGTEWNKTNSEAGLSIENLGGFNATHAEPEMVVYFLDKATYYGDGLNRDDDTVAYLNGTSSVDCD